MRDGTRGSALKNIIYLYFPVLYQCLFFCIIERGLVLKYRHLRVARVDGASLLFSPGPAELGWVTITIASLVDAGLEMKKDIDIFLDPNKEVRCARRRKVKPDLFPIFSSLVLNVSFAKLNL